MRCVCGAKEVRRSVAATLPEIAAVEWLSDGRRVRITVACGTDEAFYGFGERYNALNQRGNVMDIRVYEQYKSQGKRTYMPIPFMLSSAGYGIYVESSRWMQFDLTAPDRWVLEADLGEEQELRLVWFRSVDPVEIIGAFAQMTGPVALAARLVVWAVDEQQRMEFAGAGAARSRGIGRERDSAVGAGDRGMERRNDVLHLERRGVSGDERRQVPELWRFHFSSGRQVA